MVFALLIAAILWNLGTWWRGLPASSSHTLVGSIIRNLCAAWVLTVPMAIVLSGSLYWLFTHIFQGPTT